MLSLFKKKKHASQQTASTGADRGILVFGHTGDVIIAEKILKKTGRPVRVMGPPPEIRTGCDLVIEFPLIEELDILRDLEGAGIAPLSVVPVTAPLLEPVSLFQTTDYGDYFMVRAANMKITIENISGGGCPDVPYLAGRMVGKTLDAAPRPRDLGHTLCGYALDLAYEEMLRIC